MIGFTDSIYKPRFIESRHLNAVLRLCQYLLWSWQAILFNMIAAISSTRTLVHSMVFESVVGSTSYRLSLPGPPVTE